MWLFFVIAILVYIWPGHISGGAEALEEITGIPWQASATIGLLVIAVMFTVVKVIYNLIEGLLAFLVGVLVIGSAIVGAFVGSLSDLGDTLVGDGPLRHGIPSEAFTAAFFPVVVGALAFAGPSGMQQMWYTLWLRDKGAGMGVHIPRVRGLLHAGRGGDDPRQRVDVRHGGPRGDAQVEGLAQVGRLRRRRPVLRHHDAGHDHLHGHGHECGRAQSRRPRGAARE